MTTKPVEAERERVWKVLSKKLQVQASGLDAKTVSLNKRNYKRLSLVAGIAALISVAIWGWRLQPPAGKQQAIHRLATSGKPEFFTLPDGSSVWLNAYSVLQLDEHFSGHRHLTLQGEAYFQVVSDSLRPFAVKAGNTLTKALGTAFNVSAYADASEIQVALIEGKVLVEIPKGSVPLSPQKRLTVSKNTGNYITDTFEEDQPYAWKDGIIYFDGANVREVAEKLRRWYGIEFTLQQSDLMKSELVYRYDTREFSFEEMLDHITEVTDYQFRKRSDQDYVISPK
jgi:ferric-dicitrate binding protein FerR (iron transport regulator)